MAYGFVDPKVGTLKVNVAIDSDANIAQTTDAVVGTKAIGINGFKFDVENYEDAKKVFDKILSGIGQAKYDSSTAIVTYTTQVSEKESPALQASEDEVTLMAGNSTTVTITRLGDGKLTLLAQTEVEGITASLSGNTITFSNTTATEGTASYLVTSAETNDYSAGMVFITVSAE